MDQFELPFSATPSAPANLQEAIDYYQDANCDHPRRSQIRTAFRTVARGVQMPLDLIPADPVRLRDLLKKGSAANARVKPAAWRVYKSQSLCALREAGVDILPSRDETRISPAWQALLDQVTDRKTVIGLSRFLRFLTRSNVMPDEVSQRNFDAYLAELEGKGVRANPATSYRQTVRLWKRCSTATPEWPIVELASASDPRRFSLDWNEFPESFRRDVDAFLNARLDPDPLMGDAPAKVRPDTDYGRRKTIRALASALVLGSDMNVCELTELAVVTQPVNLRKALLYLRDERHGGEHRHQLLAYADLARIIAKHWEKDAEKAVEIARLTSSIKAQLPVARGLTPTNRQRLAQFDEPINVKALIELPGNTLKTVARGPRTHLSAVRVMYALQVALLLAIPLRLKNLASLKLGENIIISGTGKTRQVRLYLSRDETKTYTDFSAPLPTRCLPLLDAWLDVWRPIVCAQPTPYLFPNASGELRSRDALSQKICRFIKRETGLEMHLHLFRHLAAKLYLSHDPQGIETVRQLLGHKTIKTTLKAYAELQTEPAFRRLENALLDAHDRPGQRRRSNP